jgi:hypothetical protein
MVDSTQRDHGDAPAERTSSATRSGRDQTCEMSATRKRELRRSESQVQKRSWSMKRTYAGICITSASRNWIGGCGAYREQVGFERAEAQ